MTQTRGEASVLVFACPHGVGKSRIAAALFQAAAAEAGLTRWTATTAAGEDPGTELSPHAAGLLTGSPAEPFLEHGPARNLAPVANHGGAGRVLVVGIDLDDPPVRLDHAWSLASTEPGAGMRDEIDHLVTGLIRTLDQRSRAESDGR